MLCFCIISSNLQFLLIVCWLLIYCDNYMLCATASVCLCYHGDSIVVLLQCWYPLLPPFVLSCYTGAHSGPSLGSYMLLYTDSASVLIAPIQMYTGCCACLHLPHLTSTAQTDTAAQMHPCTPQTHIYTTQLRTAFR